MFGGYDTGVRLGQGDLAVEAGYMRAGEVGRFERKVDGIRANGVASPDIGPQRTTIGRLGRTSVTTTVRCSVGRLRGRPNAELRAESVIRDNIDSLHLNGGYRP